MRQRADASVLSDEQQIHVVVAHTSHRVVGHLARVRDGRELLGRVDGRMGDADPLVVDEVAAEPCRADRDSVAGKGARLTGRARAAFSENERRRI